MKALNGNSHNSNVYYDYILLRKCAVVKVKDAQMRSFGYLHKKEQIIC